MKNMTLEHIAAVCGGTYIGSETDKKREIMGAVIDSRLVEKDYLFIPVRGEKVDGHSFIPSVFEKGALAVLSEEKLESPEGPYILVENTLDAMKKIAADYRRGLDIKVVGITGSVGKTSTKEMIAAVLGQKYNVLKTQGNFNNELGLPLTVFGLRSEHQIAVLEMGISDFGEMHRLAKIARPDTCVITNIGLCHLEFLKSRDGILKAKTEIFDFLKEDGHVILNGDDDKLITVTDVKGIKPVFFGVENKNGIWADEIESKGLKGIECRIHVKDESFKVLVPIPGRHMVYNALAGTAVGLTYGLTLDEIKAGIESLQSLSGRFHILENEKKNITVIDDCYNANPVSMKASLEVLQDALGRKVALLGDMGELGKSEVEMHREVGRFAAEKDIDVIVCTGTLCKEMAESAKEVLKETSTEKTVLYFENREALESALDELILPGDSILVKASHFMQFEKIVKKLAE